MYIKIYQIKDLENCMYGFMPWRLAKKNFSLNDYECVYDYFYMSRPNKENGYKLTVDVNKLLDDIFRKFNMDRPEDFKGHSLSVSDVVSIDDELYYCDSFGWTKIS